LHIAFPFLIFAKIHKNTSPSVLHIGFAFLETWQILEEAWHLYKSVRDLANTDLPRLPRAIGKHRPRQQQDGSAIVVQRPPVSGDRGLLANHHLQSCKPRMLSQDNSPI